MLDACDSTPMRSVVIYRYYSVMFLLSQLGLQFFQVYNPKQTANVVNFFWRRLFAFCSRWTQCGDVYEPISASRINYDLVFSIVYF